MIMRLFTMLFLILISACVSAAQSVEQQVSKIRALYAETNKRIEVGAKDKTQGFHYASWLMGGERDGQQWSAVGSMKATNEFWFDGEPNRDEEETGDARKLIRKIISSYQGAADLRTRSEYIFTGEGEMVFAFTSELDPEGKTIERRFYYAKDKLIRIARDGKNIERNFGEEDKQLSANALQEAKRLQKVFAMMLEE